MNTTTDPYPDPMRDALIKLVKQQHGEDCFERLLHIGSLTTPCSDYREGYDAIDWEKE